MKLALSSREVNGADDMTVEYPTHSDPPLSCSCSQNLKVKYLAPLFVAKMPQLAILGQFLPNFKRIDFREFKDFYMSFDLK